MVLTRATDNRLKTFFSAARSATARRHFREKDFARSGRRPSTLRQSGCGGANAIAEPMAAWNGDMVAPMIRDLGVAGHAARARDGANGAERADGEGRPAVRRQGSAHRRFRLGHSAAGRAPGHLDADDRRHGDGVSRGKARGASRVSFIGRGRIFARRMARGHQPLCGRGGCRRFSASQNNQTGAVDAGRRSVGRARVRRQGGRLRDSRHHDRRHRSRQHRRGVRMGRRAGARGRRARR